MSCWAHNLLLSNKSIQIRHTRVNWMLIGDIRLFDVYFNLEVRIVYLHGNSIPLLFDIYI